MRFPKLGKSVAVVLALAFAAPVMGGCAVATGEEGADPAKIGVTQQAVAAPPITPLGGVQAVLGIVGAISSYENSQDLKAAQQQVLAKVDEVKQQLDALQVSVNTLQDSLDTTLIATVDDSATNKVNDVDALWSAYTFACNNGTRDQFLQDLREGKLDNIGKLSMADLQGMDDILRGTLSKPSLLTVFAEAYAKKGVDFVKEDRLGILMASRTLVQAKAYFLMREANRGFVDLAQMKKDYEDRQVAQRVAFFEATELYNNRIIDALGASRAAQIGACTYDPAQDNALTWLFGRLPEDGERTNFIYTDNGNTVESVWPKRGCEANRSNYISNLKSTITWQTRDNTLLPAENTMQAFREQAAVGKYMYTMSDGETRTVEVTRRADGVLLWPESGNPRCTMTMVRNDSWYYGLVLGPDCVWQGQAKPNAATLDVTYPTGVVTGVTWNNAGTYVKLRQ